MNFPVDLHMKGNWKTSYSSSKSCKLYGYYLDYTGFQVRWRKINVSVFQLIKEGGTGKTFSIQVTLLDLTSQVSKLFEIILSFLIAFSL